jgi:hypothetical protein
MGWAVVLPPATSRAALSVDRSWSLGSGVTLQRWFDPSGPIHAFVLKFKPASTPATLDIAMPGPQLPTDDELSDIGASHGALAGINGDFGHDRPLHATAVDGRFWQTGPQHGANFALSAGERNAHIGQGRPRVTASGSTGTFRVRRWNSGDPRGSEVAGFSPAGGSMEDPPRDACSARLEPTGRQFWTAGKRAVAREYRVDAASCGADAMAERGMTVLSARQGAPRRVTNTLDDLRRGSTVTVRWSMGWRNVLDTIGGRPLLVDAGANVAPSQCKFYLCGKNPRTGIGIDANGNVLLVVVDGRIADWSVGMYLTEFGDFFRNELNATHAMNLDGGGSAAMWTQERGPWCSPESTATNGCIVNYTNVGNHFLQRQVENAALILPGADPGEQPPPRAP